MNVPAAASPPTDVATPVVAAPPPSVIIAGADVAAPAAVPFPSDPADPVPVVDVGENVESGSLGGTESDANTASSFEEIDEKEAASIPEVEVMSSNRGASLKKEEDEGER